MQYKKILSPVVAALVIVFLVILLRGFFAADDTASRLSILSDGFYMAGILLVSSFLLRLVNREGTFDVMTYNLKLLFPMKRTKYEEHRKKDAYAYMEEKRAARQKRDAGVPALIVGVLCILAAVGFVALYRRAV